MCVYACVISAAAASPAAAQECRFPLETPQWNTLSTSRHAEAADLNADGVPDIVATAYEFAGISQVTVILSDGAGAYLPAVGYAVGDEPYYLALADLDGANGADLVVVVRGSEELVPLLNNGAGGFSVGTPYPVPGGSPWQVSAGDLDGDGLDDAVVLLPGTNSAQILLNDGAGGFSFWGVIPFSADPYSSAIGDATGNGLNDLAITVPDAMNPLGGFGVVYFYDNLGEDPMTGDWLGVTVIPGETGTSPFPQDLVFGDVDGMPGDELVVSCNELNADTGRTDLMSNPVAGVFQSVDTAVVGESASASAIGDLDGDTLPDIATAIGRFTGGGLNVEQIAVQFNLGGAAFGAPQVFSVPGGHLFQSLSMVDLDADGDLEVVGAGVGRAAVTAFLNPGDGQFADPLGFGLGFSPTELTIEDANMDGDPDVFVIGLSNTLAVFWSDGVGGYLPRDDYAALRGFSLPVTDLNGDTWPDVLLPGPGFDGMAILLNDQMGGLTPAPATIDLPSTAWALRDFAVGTFDADAFVDIAAVAVDGSFSPHLLIYAGDGMGGFVLGPQRSLGSQSTRIEAADLDNDGDTDVAISRISTGVDVYLNNGAATFSGPLSEPLAASGSLASNLLIADLNDDSLPEILAVSNGAGAQGVLTVQLNQGAGSFQTQPGNPQPTRLIGLEAGDVDGDGITDILVGQSTSSSDSGESPVSLLLYRGLGGVSFAEPVGFASTSGPKAIGVADLDGDQVNDAAAAGGTRLEIVRGQPCAAPAGPCIGDANGDLLVNFADVTAVLASWNADYSPGTGPGDANADGLVNFADITAVLASWNQSCP